MLQVLKIFNCFTITQVLLDAFNDFLVFL